MPQLLLVSLLWAFSFGLVARVSPLGAPFVTLARTAAALLVFLPFLRVKGMRARHAFGLAGIGALQFGLMYVLYTWAFAWLNPAEVALFTVFTPLHVTLVEALLARRLDWLFPLTALLAVAGTAVCVWTSLARGGLWAGFLAVQGSNAAFALGQVLYRRLALRLGRPDRELMGLLYAGALVATLPFAAGSLRLEILQRVTASQALLLLYLGAVASGLGFFLFNAGARRTDVGTLAILNNAKIPLAILVSALVFKAKVDAGRLLLGGGVLMGALALNAGALRLRR